jgi:hypothetical protein
MPPKKQVLTTEEKTTTEKKATTEKNTRNSKNKKIEVEKNIVDITDVTKDENINFVNEVKLSKIAIDDSIDDSNVNTNLNEDLEDALPDKPLNLKTNSKFYICENHYLNLDKTKFSEISNTDLTSLLFLRLLNSGNPLAKFVISIHRALVDPVNSNLQNLEGYRQVLTNRTENTFRNKDKYNKNKENNFENSNKSNSQGFTRFRKFNNSDNHNITREQMLTNSFENENKETYKRNFNRSRVNNE